MTKLCLSYYICNRTYLWVVLWAIGLSQSLLAAPKDSLEFTIWYQKIDSLSQNDILPYLHQGLQSSRIENDPFREAKIAFRIAYHYGVTAGRPDSLLKYSLIAQEHYQITSSHVQAARSMMFVGIAEFQLGNEKPAMDWYVKASDLYQQIGADSLLASLYINMGHSLKDIDYPLYVQYLIKANNLSRQFNEPRQEAITCLGLGDVYIKKNNLDSTYLYMDRAIKLATKLNDKQLLSYSYRNLAIIEKANYNDSQAVRYYKKAITAADNNRDKAIFHQQLGELYSNLENYTSANDHLEQAEVIAQASGSYQLLELIYAVWRAPLEKTGQLKKALDISKKYITLKDSTHSTAVKAKVAELTTQYEIEKKEKENQKLIAQGAEQRLNIKELQFAYRNRQWIIILLSLVALVGMASYIYYRKHTQQLLMISNQESQLQEQKIKELKQDKELIYIKSLIQGQESERSRIAKDLHDGMGGTFATIKRLLEHIAKKTDRLDDNDLILNCKDLVEKANIEIRRIANNMLPTSLSRFGLLVALEDMIEEAISNSEIIIDFEHYNYSLELNKNIELDIYRIIQELLNNAIKHANPSEIIIQLVQTESVLDITVEDNGIGISKTDMNSGSGIGNIRSRLSYLGGSITWDSRIDNGTSVSIELPISDIQLPITV